MKIVIVTGGFDPLHSGHIEYFKAARALGDQLWVGLNSDEWLMRKKGKAFLPYKERCAIIKNLYMVDKIITYNDKKDNSVNAIFNTMMEIQDCDEIIFANGGDRTEENTPEVDAYKNISGVSFAFGVGGGKQNSSSIILDDWKRPKTQRSWGYYRVLMSDNPSVKLKEMTVNPNKSLSMQRHKERSEFWFVSSGTATVHTISPVSSDLELRGTYKPHSYLTINENEWHMLSNETDELLKVIEIQYGTRCEEDDIVRKSLYPDYA